jgi:hypothetical protein
VTLTGERETNSGRFVRRQRGFCVSVASFAVIPEVDGTHGG